MYSVYCLLICVPCVSFEVEHFPCEFSVDQYYRCQKRVRQWTPTSARDVFESCNQMSSDILAVLVLLSAQIPQAHSLVALQNPPSSNFTDLESFVPSDYRASHVPVCDIVVLSELPTHWSSSSRPVKLTSNFSHAGLVTKCTFLYAFCTDEDPHKVAKEAHNFIILQKKLIGNIYVVVLFLQGNYHDQRVSLESLAEVIQKPVVFVSNGRRIKYKNKHMRSCKPQDLTCALQGRQIRVGYSQHKPYIHFTDWRGVEDLRNQQFVLSPSNVHTVGAKLVGMEAELLKLLCEQYNMTLILSLYDYGTGLPNGTWVGKLGVVKAGRVEIVVGRLAGLLSSLFAPLRPFTPTVWYSIGVSMVLVGVCLWLVVCFHAWLFNFHCKITILRAFELVTNALVNVPWTKAHNRIPKFLAGVWLLMAAILQASYSSRLMLSYSIVEYEKSPETVQDLISMGRTALVLNGGTTSSILSRYQNLQVERLSHEVTPAELTATKVTLSNPSNYILKILKYGGRPLSDYHLGRKPILQIFSSWLYSFQYEMKHEIDLAILRAGQFGLLSKWASEQQTLLRRQQKDGEGADNHVEFKNAPISLWNLQAVFLVFVVGNLLATVTFIGEQIISTLQKMNLYWMELL